MELRCHNERDGSRRLFDEKKRARQDPLARKTRDCRIRSLKFCFAQACGELLLLGEATGGQGVPGVGLIPELLGDVPPLLWPFSFPAVDEFGFEELEFDDPELGDPEFGTEPAFGVVEEDPFVVPGRVPHGDPLGELPGFGVYGLVDGWLFVFGVPVGDVEPGAV